MRFGVQTLATAGHILTVTWSTCPRMSKTGIHYMEGKASNHPHSTSAMEKLKVLTLQFAYGLRVLEMTFTTINMYC